MWKTFKLAAEHRQWATWVTKHGHTELGTRPLIAPVKAWLRRRGNGPRAKAAITQVVTGGAITQATLYEWGWSTDGTCRQCGNAAGTDIHRYHLCPARQAQKWELDPTWQHVAEADCQRGHRKLLWGRGLRADPSAEWVFRPPPGNTLVYEVPPDWDGILTGHVYTDGSKDGPTMWAQCGWGWHAPPAQEGQENARPGLAAYGAMPCTLPVQHQIKRAELWAILQVLQVGSPPLTVHTDHMAVLQGAARGAKWCTAAARAHADVWRDIWFRIEDLGGLGPETVTFAHVKAHRTAEAKRCMGADERHHTAGNDAADVLAKRGAELDSNWGRTATLQAAAA